MNFFTTLLVFLLTLTVSHALPSDGFCARFGEVIRYCLKQNGDEIFNSLRPTFDFENYLAWTKVQYALDHIGYDDAVDKIAANLYSLDFVDFGVPSVQELYDYLSDIENLKMAFASGAKLSTVNDVHVAHLAAIKNNLDALRVIFSRRKQALWYKTKWSKSTPLHMAVLHGSNEAVRFLLQQGADALAPNARGLSPLELATWCENSDILKTFIYHLARKDLLKPSNESVGVLRATIVAVRWGYLDVAAFLNQFTSKFYQMADLETGCTLLHLAANNASGATISGFLKSVPISNCKRGYLPHFYTVLRGEIGILPTFDAATLNATGTCGLNCLDVAVLSGNCDLVKKLVKKLKPSKEKLLNATFLAIRYNLVPIVEFMKSKGVSSTDIYRGMRFYEYIFQDNRTNFAKWIKICGKMEWENLDIGGLLLPDIAVINRDSELLESLLATGLDCRFHLANGISALQYAIQNELNDIALILEQHKNYKFYTFQFLDASS